MKQISFAVICSFIALGSFAQATIPNGTYTIQGVGSGLNIDEVRNVDFQGSLPLHSVSGALTQPAHNCCETVVYTPTSTLWMVRR